MTEAAVKLGVGGRVVIPAEVRDAMGLDVGDVLVLVVEPDGLRLLTPSQAVRRAQAMVARFVEPGRDLVGELIHERRAEADDA